MNRQPDVSILMANHNGARYLPAAVSSILRQSLTSWELIIVDDASTDDSVVAAQHAAAGDPRIRIVVQRVNRGPAAARNRALELATGRWIAIVDSDDLLHRQRLELMLQRASRDGASIVADNLMVFSENAPPQPFLPPRFLHAPLWIELPTFIESNCLYSRVPDLGYLKPVIRADVIHELRYDETLRIGEDYHFLLRLMARGRRLRLDPAGLYFYRKHESSVSHRLHSADIERLCEAEARFAATVVLFDERLHAALARRRETLLSLMTYDKIIGALKSRDIARAARLAFHRPHIWPLLTQPASARLKRARRKFYKAMGVDQSSIDETQLQGMLLETSAAHASGATP